MRDSWYLQVTCLWHRCSGIERISSRDITINRWRWRSVACRRTRMPVTGLPSSNTEITSITYGLISTRPLLMAFRTRPLSVTSSAHHYTRMPMKHICRQHSQNCAKTAKLNHYSMAKKYQTIWQLVPIDSHLYYQGSILAKFCWVQ